jgi:hypothetical protein
MSSASAGLVASPGSADPAALCPFTRRIWTVDGPGSGVMLRHVDGGGHIRGTATFASLGAVALALLALLLVRQVGLSGVSEFGQAPSSSWAPTRMAIN